MCTNRDFFKGVEVRLDCLPSSEKGMCVCLTINGNGVPF